MPGFTKDSETNTGLKVEVKVFATLRRYFPDLGIGEPLSLEVPPGTTLEDIRGMLGLPEEEVKVVMRNNLQADFQDTVADGDRIAYIPAVAGG
jgi:molybdopterin synthase sulfur carrier subunit